MINRIRKRSGLLIIVIGGAMVAFILGGLLRQGGCSRQRPQMADVGEIYGKKIPKEQYQQKVDQQVQQLRKNRQKEIDEEMKQRIRDQVWRRMVQERLFGKHMKELGIEVPSAELKDLLAGDNVHPRIRKIFEQQMGTFNKEMVLRQIKRSYKQNQQARKQWTRMTESIVQEREFKKFINLVKKAMYANDVETRDAYRGQNRTIDLRYVLRPYRSLPDEKVDLQESDLRSYYEEHKNDPEYEQEASRSFKYVIVDASPSQKDLKRGKKKMEELRSHFKKETKDSLYASNQSDRPGSPIEFLRKGEVADSTTDSLLFKASKGEVIGPVRDGESFTLYKVQGKEKRPDSVKVSHILLGRGIRGKDDSLKRVADSLKKVVQEEGQPFGPLAKRISEDPRSARKNGSLGWVRPGRMLPAFDSAVFHADTGSYPVVKTRAGYHLIQVEERTKPVQQVKTVVIEKEVRPSEATLDSAFNLAKKVRMDSKGESSFQKMAQKMGLRVRLASRVRESDRSVARLENSRELVRWAYNAEKGNISRAIRCGDKFIVALLTEVKKEGTPSFANVKDEMREKVMENKKAERFKKEMKGGYNLDSLASAHGLQVRTAKDVSFSSNSLPGGGNEPYVIGKLMTVSQDAYTHPIQGNAGVYLALVTNVDKAGKPSKRELASLQQRLQLRRGRWVQRNLFDLLKEHANVEDRRNTLR